MRYLSLKVIKTIKINDKEVGDTLHSSVQSLFQLVSINSLREKTFAIDSMQMHQSESAYYQDTTQTH